MNEILLGAVGVFALALYIVFKGWQEERERRIEAEKKVKAHELLQEIDEDIADGGDDYVAEQLRKYNRDLQRD